MSKNKELVKNTVIIFIGKIFTQFLTFLLLPLYTSKLATSEYGTVDLVITYVTLFAPIIVLQLESAIFRYLIDARKKIEEKNNIISNVYIFSIISIFCCLILFFVVNLFVSVDYSWYIALMVISTTFSGISLQTARGLGDNIGYAIASVISGVCNLSLNVVFLCVLHLDIRFVFIAQIISQFLIILFLFIRLKIHKYIRIQYFNKNSMNKLLKYSLPLIPNGIIWWIINISDRTIVSIIMGLSANGIYTVSNKFSTIFISIYNIFNLSWTESVSLHIEDDDREEFISNVFDKTLKIFMCIAMLMITLLPFVFNLIIDFNYNEAYLYIPILLVSTIFTIIVSMFGAIYVAKKLTKEVAKTSLYSGILNIVINLLFIKKIGLYAAAISTLLSFMMMSVYRYFDVKKYVNIKINWKFYLSAVVMFSVSIFLYYYNNLFGNIINLLIVTIYSYIINKDFIMDILNTVIKKKFFKKGNKCQRLK